MSSATPKIHLRLEYDGRVVHEADDLELPPELTIGRAADNAWQLPKEDAGASSHHAVLKRLRNGALLLQDKGSTNGIYYLGKRVKEHRLQPGDICSIGDSKLVAKAIDRPEQKAGTLLYNQLEQLSGEEKGKVYRIQQEVFRIGSAAECECRIQDSLVSKLHAVIEQHPDGTCWIKDQHSRNGTMVNGMPLRDDHTQIGRMLKDGDIVAVAYVELKFWDKNVVHVRSHLVLRLCVVVITLAVALGGYFGFRALTPTARELRFRAERVAAKGTPAAFAAAKELLVKAAEARSAELDQAKRRELSERLKLWIETAPAWQKLKEELAGKTLPELSKEQIGALEKLSALGKDNWNCNDTEGLTQMKQDNDTAALVAAARTVEDALERYNRSEDNLKLLDAALEKLQKSIGNCQEEQMDFRAGLLASGRNAAEELALTLGQYRKVEGLVQQYQRLDQTDGLVVALREIRDGWEKHRRERLEQKRPVSEWVARQCGDYLEPLERLQSCNRRLEDYYIAFAGFDAGGARDFANDLAELKGLNIATQENLSGRCNELKEEFETLEDFHRYHLKECRKVYNDLSTKGEWAELLRYFFAPATLDKVLAVDCLDAPMSDPADDRSSYGTVLGGQAFYEFLRNIDFPEAFNLEEFHPTPLIFRAKDFFTELARIRRDLHPEAGLKSKYRLVVARLLGQQGGENALARLDRKAEEVLKHRDDFVRKVYEISVQEPDSRRGILAGGMAYCLMTRENDFVKEGEEALAARISKSFKALNRVLGELSAPPDGNSRTAADEAKMLEIGIPGHKLLEDPWRNKYNTED